MITQERPDGPLSLSLFNPLPQTYLSDASKMQNWLFYFLA